MSQQARLRPRKLQARTLSSSQPHTLSKSERISRKLVVDSLFNGENKSLVAYPLRVVYALLPKDDEEASILVSVPKKKFHHAVDRNRMKRQVRESYRMNKDVIMKKMAGRDEMLAMAFVCIADQPCESEQVKRSVMKLLHKIAETLNQ